MIGTKEKYLYSHSFMSRIYFGGWCRDQRISLVYFFFDFSNLTLHHFSRNLSILSSRIITRFCSINKNMEENQSMVHCLKFSSFHENIADLFFYSDSKLSASLSHTFSDIHLFSSFYLYIKIMFKSFRLMYTCLRVFIYTCCRLHYCELYLTL